MAATFYLPNHFAYIYNRIWYYVSGELKQVLNSTEGLGLGLPQKGQDIAATTTTTAATIAVQSVQSIQRVVETVEGEF